MKDGVQYSARDDSRLVRLEANIQGSILTISAQAIDVSRDDLVVDLDGSFGTHVIEYVFLICDYFLLFDVFFLSKSRST